MKLFFKNQKAYHLTKYLKIFCTLSIFLPLIAACNVFNGQLIDTTSYAQTQHRNADGTVMTEKVLSNNDKNHQEDDGHQKNANELLGYGMNKPKNLMAMFFTEENSNNASSAIMHATGKADSVAIPMANGKQISNIAAADEVHHKNSNQSVTLLELIKEKRGQSLNANDATRANSKNDELNIQTEQQKPDTLMRLFYGGREPIKKIEKNLTKQLADKESGNFDIPEYSAGLSSVHGSGHINGKQHH